MATTSPVLPPLPRYDVPFIMKDGSINPDWYAWLNTLAIIIKQLRTEV